jgi:pimeloyl-ACP methyl ester carboxylesterase
MPYFADRGHDTYAISFRSQGKSDRQLGVKSAGTLASHAADLDHFVSTLDQPPVIIAHSLSGLIAQRYLLFILGVVLQTWSASKLMQLL